MTTQHCAIHPGIMMIVALTLFASAGSMAQQPAAIGPLNVDDAVIYALQHNPLVMHGLQDLQIAQEEITVARANGLPAASLSINNTYIPSPLTEFNIPLETSLGGVAQLSVTQPLWPTSRWAAPIASAHAGVGISAETLARTRQQVMFQTRQAFYQVLTAQELLQVDQEAVDVAARQLELSTNTVNAGLAAPLDVYQSKAALADAQLTLVRADNTLAVAKAVLATQLGLPAGAVVALTPPQTLPTAPPDVEALVQEALINRPEMAQFIYRRKQILAQMDITRLQTLPLLGLTGSYAAPVYGTNALAAAGLSVGLSLAINLYDGGATKAELQQSRIRLSQVDTDARQTELTITLDVRQAWLDLQNAQQQLADADVQHTAAAEALRISEVRYANGEGIVLEVEQARLRLTQALTALAQARFQAQLADAQLAYALGCPTPDVPPVITLPWPVVVPHVATLGK